MISAHQALERLRAGNRRFVSGAGSVDAEASQLRRADLVAGQAPFAAILGCSDSRVPPELIFDQGLGDLFAIRVAGNVAGPSQIASIEYAADTLGTRLLVVLGHSSCGAVSATLEELARPTEDQSPHLRSLLGHIRPAVEPLLATDLRNDPNALLQSAVRANVRASINDLLRQSQVLERLARDGELLVVGAEYSLETGTVEFFENAPV